MNRTRAGAWASWLVLATIAGPRVAQADSKAVAEALFRDGSQLLADKHVDEACSKLAESQKIDPALGTLLYLAACHEDQGRTASAWAEFSSAKQWAERTDQMERAAFAEQHIESIEPLLSSIVIAAPGIPGLELRLDDALLSAAVAGTPLPVDPGKHTVEATAPEHDPWRTTIAIPSSPGKVRITVPNLALTHRPADLNTQPVAFTPPAPATPVKRAFPMMRTLTWGTVGLAATGIVAGSIFGGLALSSRDGATAECSNNRCSSRGLDDIDRARTYATVSTVAFGTGVVAAIAAAYFLLRGAGHDDGQIAPSSATGVPHPLIMVQGGTVVLFRFE